MVIGCSGAGKSTLSYRIHKITQLPLYHLDRIFWKPGWVSLEQEEWQNANKELVLKDKWLIDGNYGSTMDMRLARADTVVFVNRSTLTCLYRVIKRRYFGSRDDITTGCHEKLDFEFLHYVARYNTSGRPGILKKLNALGSDKKVYILNSTHDNYEFLKSLETFF